MTTESTDSETEAAAAALRHFIAGATPALLAGTALIAHINSPIVEPQHQGILVCLIVIAVITSATSLLWFAVRRTYIYFKLRHDQSAEELRKLAESDAQLCRAVQGLHKKIDILRGEIADLSAENDHLRQLYIDSGIPQQTNNRQGPRPLA